MQVSLTEMKNRGDVYSNIRIETNKITIISFAGKRLLLRQTVAANIKMNYQLILKDISVL